MCFDKNVLAPTKKVRVQDLTKLVATNFVQLMSKESIKQILEERFERYCTPEFIPDDPISIPHRFSKKRDIEIAGFLTATIAWGNRKSILKSSSKMMALMDEAPADFVLNHQASDLQVFNGFVHRTFNEIDIQYFITSLQDIYQNQGGLEQTMCVLESGARSMKPSLASFHDTFFSLEHLKRTQKHVANPERGSSAKRLNMFLRWMVRNDDRGVDFGLWKNVPMSILSCPLDVHSGNEARKLGLLSRKQNDWKAVEELDASLRQFDPEDPVKYDYALFGNAVVGK